MFILMSGSRIRAAVALIPFDEFHRHSAQVIQQAVFRDPVTGATYPFLKFDANNLVCYTAPNLK
jgi:major vault protein